MIVRVNNKVIGEIFPNSKLFVKNVRLSRHLFIVHDGWAIDASYFDSVILRLCERIYVLEGEENKLYIASTKDFKEHAIEIFHGKHGRQYCLPRSYWSVSNKRDSKPRVKVGQGTLI